MKLTKEQVKEKLKDRMWRLTAWYIYKIKDRDWNVIPFKPNPQQLRFLKNMHYRNIILKARQQWFSTLIDLFLLDAVVFTANTRAKIIAQTESLAMEIFQDKIKVPFDNLPDFIKENVKIVKSNVSELFFNNNSQITVSTSGRWSSLNLLHISEFWPICADSALKAKEIVDWALKSVSKNWFIAIESTAKGKGKFYDMYWGAKNFQFNNNLTSMDYKSHFFPWHEEPWYAIESNEIITDKDEEYFKTVEASTGKKLTKEQKNWYVKERRYSDNMFAEHPSYEEEAFMDSHDWIWYRKWMTDLRLDGRLASKLYDPNLDCHTYWDIWMDDATAIIIVQFYGKEIRIIDEISSEWEWLEYYVSKLNSKPYTYINHTAPHDIEVKEWWGAETRRTTARKLWIKFDVWPKPPVIEWINAVRKIFHRFIIDEQKCPELIKSLDNYSKEWDGKNEIFKEKPDHNKYSHFADAVRLLWLMIKRVEKPETSTRNKRLIRRSALTGHIIK